MKIVEEMKTAIEALVDSGCQWKEFQTMLGAAYFAELLKRTRGNQCQAAKFAGMHRNNVRLWIQKCGIKYARMPKQKPRELAEETGAE